MVDARSKILQPGPAARSAGRQAQLLQIGPLEAQLLEARHVRGRVTRQRIGVLLYWIRSDVEGAKTLQPGVLVRGEHAEGPACARQDLVLLEDDLIFEGVELDALLQQSALHRPVALERSRLVVVVGIDRLSVQQTRQLRDLVSRTAVQYQQRAAHLLEGRAQLHDALPDEFHAPVSPAGQRIQDLGVEYENAVDGPAGLERVIQRGVIMST